MCYFKLKAMSCNDSTCQIKHIENFKGKSHIKAVSPFPPFCESIVVLNSGIFRKLLTSFA